MSLGSAITSIPDHYRIAFGNSFDLALQDTKNDIRAAVSYRPGSGERVTIDRLEQIDLEDFTGRAGDTVNTDWESEITNIFPKPADVSNLFDEFDDAYLASIGLPKSELARSHAYGVNRKISDRIVRAMTGIAFRGKFGTTQVALPASQIIGVDDAGDTEGMNFEKIALAAYMFDDMDVPEEGRYLGLRPKQMADLVEDILANHSTNLSDIRMMPNTRVITQILGFNVLLSTRFLVDEDTDIATCPAWQRDQVVLSMWQDRKTYMDILPDRRHALQVRTVMNGDAARKDDKGVIAILADQSPST